MNETLTVSEVADKIADPIGGPYDKTRIIRQLRHWTLSNILRPVGGTHTGIGRHRQYSQESVLVAAVLVELSKLGLSVGTLQWATLHLYDLFKGKAASVNYWRGEVKRSSLFLRLTFDIAEGQDHPVCAVSSLVTPDNMHIGTSSVLIDLRRLLSQIKD
jgi:hypothetical protein